jgi:hypothetical protein
LSKADELAADEAEEILEHLVGSARSKRHERLSRLRERGDSSVEIGDEIVVGDRDDDERDGGDLVATGPTMARESSNLGDVFGGDETDATGGNEPEADLIQSSGIVPSVRLRLVLGREFITE